MSAASEIPGLPCCDYRDHQFGYCACPEHERSDLHPFSQAWTRAAVGDDVYCELTDTIDPGDDE